MIMGFKIVKNSKNVPVIDADGNVTYDTAIQKVYLQDEDGKRISDDYYYIECIGNNHYIVCDITSSQSGMEYQDEFDDSKLAFKYGVICLKKDDNGNVIPMAESIVVPIIYDRISGNNLNTITAYANNDHLTYIDIDPQSQNYGKQLVPVVLEHAVPFSVEYDGFAECSVSGITGYLPRNCQPLTQISPLDLLTEEQVKCLLSYLDMNNSPLYDSSIEKISKLTGETKTLKLIRNIAKSNK